MCSLSEAEAVERGERVCRAASRLPTSCMGPFDKLRAGSSARKVREPQDDRVVRLAPAVHGYSPPSFFSGRKYMAGISAKMKSEA